MKVPDDVLEGDFRDTGEVDRSGSSIVVLSEVAKAEMGRKLPVSWPVSWQAIFDGKGPS